MKTAFLISCSDHYDHRMHLWDTCLQQMGYQTRYITGDFDHTKKAKFTCNVPGAVQLPVLPYRKNLSVSRILSHRMFAKKARRYLQEHHPDVVIALLPPNFLAHYLAKYKKQHPKTKLIFDIFDLWPESFPSNKLKKLLSPIFRIWSGLRDRNLHMADFVTTECDLFRSKLRLPEDTSATVYLSAKPVQSPTQCTLAEDRLELCYLGAINNIINIDAICDLLKQAVAIKPVTLHIIGKGEQEEAFVRRARETGAHVQFYGAVYDSDQKQQILGRCHFGLNLMRSSVCVGLTMKSVDYFRFGLPIINNIPADTAAFIRDRQVGFPLDDSCAQRIAAMTPDECLAMRQRVADLFCQFFDQNTVAAQMTQILEQIIL